MSFFYTINGVHVSRETALRALCFTKVCTHRSRGVRTYRTPNGRLTVWVWPFA